MPHPSQMGSFEDQSLGGCIVNGVLAIFFLILLISFMGAHP